MACSTRGSAARGYTRHQGRRVKPWWRSTAGRASSGTHARNCSDGRHVLIAESLSRGAAVGGVFVEDAFVDTFERVDESIPAENADGAIVGGSAHALGVIAIREQREDCDSATAGPSPTGTSRPVSPSAIDSGAPPERQPMLGLRERAASTYTSAHGSRREGRAITSMAFMRLATSRRKPRKRMFDITPVCSADLVQLLPQLAFAHDPELRLGQLAKDDGDGLEQVAVAFFLGEMSERADDRRIGFRAELGADQQRIARGEEVVGRDGVVQHGETLGGDSLLHQVAFHGVRDGEQMRLMAMPRGRGEALHVADRRRAAEAFEPAAPPTGGGKRGLNEVGAMLSCRPRQQWESGDVGLARNPQGLRVEAEAVHFGNGGAAALDQRGDSVAAGLSCGASSGRVASRRPTCAKA